MRASLADAGSGILTEIDLRATMRSKLDVDIAPQVILGACRPQLAHAALEVDPTFAAVLPCNVVVRATGDDACVVDAVDPDVMIGMAGDDEALREVASDAKQRLTTALGSLGPQ